MPIKPSVLLFHAGIGSRVKAYEKIGFVVKEAIEENESRRKELEKNCEGIKISGSLQKLEYSPTDVEKSIDVLDTMIPYGYLENAKELLIHWRKQFLRNVRTIQPKILVVHSSSNSKKRASTLWWNELQLVVRNLGYTVEWQVLKASHYGVPQDKQWTVLIAVQKELQIKPVFPEPSEDSPTTAKAIGVLMHLPADKKLPTYREDWLTCYFPPGITLGKAKEIIDEEDLSAYAAHYRRDLWEKPFSALQPTSIRPIHPKVDRILRIDEGKRLQTMPESILTVDWKEICTDVPTALFTHIANALRQDILNYVYI